jgi:hypothetical protein
MNIVKIKGDTVAFTAANTVGDSALVRIYAAATTLVTHTGCRHDHYASGLCCVLRKGCH